MVLQEEDTPALPRFLPARALPGTAVLDHRLGLRAPIDQCACVGGIGQQLIDPMSTGQTPKDRTARGPGLHLGPWQRRLTIPSHRLASTAQCAARAEDLCDRVLDLAVGDLFKAIGARPHTSHGDFPHDMPALDVCFEGVPCSLTHQGPRIFRDRALHPQHQAIVELAWIIEAIIINQQGIGQGTPIDHMMPVPVVAGQAGGVSGDHRADLALTHGCQQLAKAWALLKAAATTPQVLIDHDDLGKPQATRVIGQRLLPPLALVMVADLMASRLAHRDRGRPVPMRATHLVAPGLSPCCARCG